MPRRCCVVGCAEIRATRHGYCALHVRMLRQAESQPQYCSLNETKRSLSVPCILPSTIQSNRIIPSRDRPTESANRTSRMSDPLQFQDSSFLLDPFVQSEKDLDRVDRQMRWNERRSTIGVSSPTMYAESVPERRSLRSSESTVEAESDKKNPHLLKLLSTSSFNESSGNPIRIQSINISGVHFSVDLVNSKRPFVMYKIDIKARTRNSDETQARGKLCTLTWTIERRFSDFIRLHELLQEKYGKKMKALTLPSKYVLSSTSRNVVQSRQRTLQSYLERVAAIQHIPQGNGQVTPEHLPEFLRFLQPPGYFEGDPIEELNSLTFPNYTLSDEDDPNIPEEVVSLSRDTHPRSRPHSVVSTSITRNSQKPNRLFRGSSKLEQLTGVDSLGLAAQRLRVHTNKGKNVSEESSKHRGSLTKTEITQTGNSLLNLLQESLHMSGIRSSGQEKARVQEEVQMQLSMALDKLLTDLEYEEAQIIRDFVVGHVRNRANVNQPVSTNIQMEREEDEGSGDQVLVQEIRGFINRMTAYVLENHQEQLVRIASPEKSKSLPRSSLQSSELLQTLIRSKEERRNTILESIGETGEINEQKSQEMTKKHRENNTEEKHVINEVHDLVYAAVERAILQSLGSYFLSRMQKHTAQQDERISQNVEMIFRIARENATSLISRYQEDGTVPSCQFSPALIRLLDDSRDDESLRLVTTWLLERWLDIPESFSGLSHAYSISALAQLSRKRVKIIPTEAFKWMLDGAKGVFDAPIRENGSAFIEPIGADDFLPIFILVLLLSGVATDQPHATIQYLWSLGSQASLQSESGYYLTAMESSIFYLSSVDQQDVENAMNFGLSVDQTVVEE